MKKVNYEKTCKILGIVLVIISFIGIVLTEVISFSMFARYNTITDGTVGIVEMITLAVGVVLTLVGGTNSCREDDDTTIEFIINNDDETL